MDNKPENMFYRLFALKLSGEASKKELELLDSLLIQYPELRFFFDEMMKTTHSSVENKDKAEQSFAAHYTRMHLRGLLSEKGISQTQTFRERRKNKQIIAYLAAATIVLALGLWWAIAIYSKSKEYLFAKNETTTSKGSKSTVTLPDGTVVMLNANSKLSYDDQFKNNKREIYLSGEAYFDVVHDSLHPFIINTRAGYIKVLGTVLDVKIHEDGFFETSLIKGKVAIHLKEYNEEDFVLKPGQKLVSVSNKNNGGADSIKIIPITIKDSLIAETSWTKGRLVFVDKPLEEIAEDLENAYGVHIIFRSNTTKQFKYTGIFDDTDIEQVFEILALSKPIKYHKEKNTITIE